MNADKIPGTVFRAHHPPPGSKQVHFVFVPDSYFRFDGSGEPDLIPYDTFDEDTYRISRWPHLNAIANGCGKGTRLMPDLEDLLPDEEGHTSQFKRFAAALDSAVKQDWKDFPL
ncbi:hypothetical protein BH09VER1_BH09VER1_17860 [soil metagenome]